MPKTHNFKRVKTDVVFLVILLGLSLPTISIDTVRAGHDPWTKSGSPILSPTPSGWDTPQVWVPRILYGGNLFRMWYLGGPDAQSKVGYATSSDGIHWTKNPNPVLQPGPSGVWDSYQITPGHVVWNGTHYLMWYRGRGTQSDPGAFGLAVSSDGVSWTKFAGNPVLTPSSADVNYLQYPYVIQVGSTLKMWFTERSGSSQLSIYYATSQDGIQWTQQGSPVLSPSSGWESVSVYSPTVIYSAGSYQMFYSGSDGSVARIGYATSNDGITWTRSTDNPIVSQGPSTSWDNGDVDNQDAIAFQSTIMLYYSGAHFESGTYTGYSIGLAQPSTISSASSTSTPSPSNCTLATAISGSELAPLAQSLRGFRDNSIQRTKAGSQFMMAFNAWYYSFSPYIAYYIALHPLERAITKYLSYPLLGILYGAYYSYTVVAPLSTEAAAVAAGIVAASLIGLVYVAPIGYLAMRLIRRRKGVLTLRRLHAIPSSVWFAASVLMIGAAYQSGSGIVMAIGTANLTLSVLSLGSILGTMALTRILLPANHTSVMFAIMSAAFTPARIKSKFRRFSISQG